MDTKLTRERLDELKAKLPHPGLLVSEVDNLIEIAEAYLIKTSAEDLVGEMLKITIEALENVTTQRNDVTNQLNQVRAELDKANQEIIQILDKLNAPADSSLTKAIDVLIKDLEFTKFMRDVWQKDQ